MSKGKDLWQRAKKAIPGGNGLLSKRPDRYASDIWPTYFSKAKGVEIWDLDGTKYIDMAQMGIGAAILGYSNDAVDARVKQAIDAGISTTLNCPEEVYLAEKLLELNPFAGGVKFARTGGEAMAIAVRIARAYTGKDQVAFSGYHGWCDWYIAANIQGENQLKDHLLPGLAPKGVPAGLASTSFPFKYNDVDDLRRVIAENDIGVIVIESARYDFPSNEFLDEIENISRSKGIVVVLDEITSGWRMTDSGVYKIFKNFHPDIVVYGKAMGNGYAISAVVGKTEIMEQAQHTFISSTFWTERIGFVAALATIDILQKHRVCEHLILIGEMIGNGWEMMAEKHGIDLSITDYKPLISFKLHYDEKNQALYTLFIQEMLKRGYLAASSIYVSYSHTKEIINKYLETVDEVFGILKNAIDTNTVELRLETQVRDDAFKRLN